LRLEADLRSGCATPAEAARLCDRAAAAVTSRSGSGWAGSTPVRSAVPPTATGGSPSRSAPLRARAAPVGPCSREHKPVAGLSQQEARGDGPSRQRHATSGAGSPATAELEAGPPRLHAGRLRQESVQEPPRARSGAAPTSPGRFRRPGQRSIGRFASRCEGNPSPSTGVVPAADATTQRPSPASPRLGRPAGRPDSRDH